jgi:hypothetical protein
MLAVGLREGPPKHSFPGGTSGGEQDASGYPQGRCCGTSYPGRAPRRATLTANSREIFQITAASWGFGAVLVRP